MTPASEKHYSPKEVAELWHISLSTVRRIFRDQPGTFKHQMPRVAGQKRVPKVLLRISESALARVYEQRSRGFGEAKPRGGGVKE